MLESDFNKSSYCTCTFGTYACLAFGCVRYLTHHGRCKNCIHAPATLWLAGRCFGLFRCTNIRLMADRASSGINGVHLCLWDFRRLSLLTISRLYYMIDSNPMAKAMNSDLTIVLIDQTSSTAAFN